MDGWVRVDPCAVASDQELTRWVQVGVAYAASLPPKQRGRGEREVPRHEMAGGRPLSGLQSARKLSTDELRPSGHLWQCENRIAVVTDRLGNGASITGDDRGSAHGRRHDLSRRPRS